MVFSGRRSQLHFDDRQRPQESVKRVSLYFQMAMNDRILISQQHCSVAAASTQNVTNKKSSV